jgi:hypothetical protein
MEAGELAAVRLAPRPGIDRDAHGGGIEVGVFADAKCANRSLHRGFAATPGFDDTNIASDEQAGAYYGYYGQSTQKQHTEQDAGQDSAAARIRGHITPFSEAIRARMPKSSLISRKEFIGTAL